MTAIIPTSLIVPFGKYEGMPIEALLNDTSYVQWLMVQPWFINGKYKHVYQHVSGKCVEYSKTPVHNEMQLRFLDKDLCFNILLAISGMVGRKYRWSDLPGNVEFNFREVQSGLATCFWDCEGNLCGMINCDGSLNFSDNIKRTMKVKLDIIFEKDNWDVVLRMAAAPIVGSIKLSVLEKVCLKIELKPTVGDDYPHILRQLDARKIKKEDRKVYPDDFAEGIIVCDKFNAVSHTWEQSHQLFKNAGYFIIGYNQLKNSAEDYRRRLDFEVEFAS